MDHNFHMFAQILAEVSGAQAVAVVYIDTNGVPGSCALVNPDDPCYKKHCQDLSEAMRKLADLTEKAEGQIIPRFTPRKTQG